MTSPERNKDLVRRLILIVDQGGLDSVPDFYAPDYVDHDASAARRHPESHLAGVLEAFRAFATGFPDAQHEIHDLIAEGDRVVARISAEGTHTGEFFGVAATGRRIRNDSIVIYRIEDGRIAERWCRERSDTLGQLRRNGNGESV